MFLHIVAVLKCFIEHAEMYILKMKKQVKLNAL